MTDITKAVALAREIEKTVAGFEGRFFYDAESDDLGYIAKDCDDKQCDCSVNLNTDGDQDCSVSIGVLDGIDDVAEPIAQRLNAAATLARCVLAMAPVVEAAERLAPHVEPTGDWACAECRPNSDLLHVSPGFSREAADGGW